MVGFGVVEEAGRTGDLFLLAVLSDIVEVVAIRTDYLITLFGGRVVSIAIGAVDSAAEASV